MRFKILQLLVLKIIHEDLPLNIDTTLVFYSKGYITIFLCKNKGGLTVVKETNHALKFTLFLWCRSMWARCAVTRECLLLTRYKVRHLSVWKRKKTGNIASPHVKATTILTI